MDQKLKTRMAAIKALNPDSEIGVYGDKVIKIDFKDKITNSEDEIQSKIREMNQDLAFYILRLKRDQRLFETDIVVSRQLEKDGQVRSDLKSYRQMLRDLPSNIETICLNDDHTDIDYTIPHFN